MSSILIRATNLIKNMIKYTVPILLKDKYIFWTFIASLVIFISAFLSLMLIYGERESLIIHSGYFQREPIFSAILRMFLGLLPLPDLFGF